MSKKTQIFTVLIIVLLSVILWLPQGVWAAGPKNVIFYIGDGMGATQRRIPEEVYGERLVMNTLPVLGMYTTHCADNQVTDSAAAGTALATGHKTKNRFIAIDVDRKIAYESLARAAKRMGKSVGLLTTCAITDATPAVFGANIASRFRQNDVAEQYLAQGFDIYMGGGRDNFSPEGRVNTFGSPPRDLIKAFQSAGYQVVFDKKALLNVSPDKGTKVLGLFSIRNMPYYLDRKGSEEIPGLTDMVHIAISILKQNPKGFFLMVEGGRIDHACHANDPVATVGELVELDNAVRVGLDFSKHDSNTLILVGSDHETGGLSMGHSKALIDADVIKNATRSTVFLGEAAEKDPDQAGVIFRQYSGIRALTPEEEKQIDDARVRVLAGQLSPNPYNRSPFGFAFAGILTHRASTGWSSFAHTGEPVILTATGPGSSVFDGYYDNTDIPKKIASLWGITLRSWPIQE